MSNISYKVFDSFHDLLVSLEELIDYKDYVLSELELANSNLDTDEEAVKRVNYYSNELKKVNDKLNEVFTEVLRRKKDSIDTMRAGFGKLEKEKVPLKDTIISVVKYANLNKSFSFKKLLEEQTDKTHVIVTFLAVLELMKVGRIKVKQESSFSEIYIEVVEGATGFVDFDLLEDD